MDHWLRPVFTRTKTPVLAGPSTDRSISFSTDDSNDSEECISIKMQSTSRVSSYISFRPSTPPIPTLEIFPNLRHPENVYHKPSGDQIAEMLKVVMMSQSSIDPVPVEYNSCILQVLEAYQDLRIQLVGKDEAMEILKQSHTKDIKDFEELAAGWYQKEKDYQGEVKRLEILLSKIGGGMESVSMARLKSMIHGSEKASQTLNKGIGTIKSRNFGKSIHDTDPGDHLPAQNNKQYRQSLQAPGNKYFMSGLGSQFAQPSTTQSATIWGHHRSDHSQFVSVGAQLYVGQGLQVEKALLHGSDLPIPSFTKLQLEALEFQEAEQKPGVMFDSSTESGACSSSVSSNVELCSASKEQAFGLGSSEKPLPDIPVSTGRREIQTTLNKLLMAKHHAFLNPNSVEPPVPCQMGFSFRPGDDADILAQGTGNDRAKRETLDEHLNHQTNLDVSDLRSEAQSSGYETPGRPRAYLMKPDSHARFSTTATQSLLPRFQDGDALTRADSSSSSIITAVRDNSGRSSANGSHCKNQAGRPRLNRSVGTSSSDAVTAASRALAASNNK